MSRGDLRIKRARHKKEEQVSFDPKLSQDKKTFVLVIESTCKMSWYEAIQACAIYAKDELDLLEREVSLSQH
jgi:hypothetical protein